MVAYGVKTPPQHGTWSDFLAVWRAADDMDIFESAWTMDHLYPLLAPVDGPQLESWTALAALAPYDNDSEIPMTPRGGGFDTVDGFKTRTSFESQLDLQASYALNFGTRKLTLIADVFNVFNTRRVTDYNAAIEQSFGVANPDYGTPTSQNVAGQQFQAPFQARIGARFAW